MTKEISYKAKLSKSKKRRFKICSCECTNNIIHSAITGDISEGDTPVLIPNTEVKTFSAENTTWEAVWEDMSLPVFNYESNYGYSLFCYFSTI